MKQNVYDYSFEMRRERRRRVTRCFILVASVVFFIPLFLNYVLFPVYVRSDSMEKGIAENGMVFVCPLAKSPKRGSVVLLSRTDGRRLSFFQRFINTSVSFFTLQKYAPFGYTHKMSGKETLRRVVALPGDTIYMKDYVLYVKPAGQNLFLTEFELASKPYDVSIYSVPVEWDGMGCIGDMAETVLGSDEYFLLADNRIEAVDSRGYGPVKSSMFKGSAVLQFFPLNRIKLF